jgi:D-galactarolactone cycloisomerase
MDLPETAPFRLARLEAQTYFVPLERPLATAFGTLSGRPAVIVRAEDDEGVVGWGEAWCNFPDFGARHRALWIEQALAPLIEGGRFESPLEAFMRLTERSRLMALQSGEPGPPAQAIAGIDVALWDLVARRAGKPLWRLLAGSDDGEAARLPAYASGLGPTDAVAQAVAARAAGFSAFKLKIGFDAERDLATLAAMREALGEDAPIAVDANQAWSLQQASAMVDRLAPLGPMWLEEPLPADAPAEAWALLARVSPVPLAAGENLRGDGTFDEALAAGVLEVVQPDLAKWGGISAVFPLAWRILRAGRRYCPHYLGGGIGLLASAHVLAAAGGDGLLEIDVNPNPLREGLARPFPGLEDGRFVLGEAPGLGVTPDPALDRYRI